jgi:tetratricopeptide (TPR) repeat protein
MKLIPFVAISFLLLSAFACEAPKDYVLKAKLLQLTEKNLYDDDLVYNVIFDAEELNIDSLKDKSRGLFLKGIDLYKNKKDPQQAIKYFKSSILIFPEAKTYYELGNALMESQQSYDSKEALQAYKVAERLRFEPVSNVYYKKARAENVIYNNKMLEGERDGYNPAIGALREAFLNGFFDTTAVKNDPCLKSIIATVDYKQMILEVLIKNTKDSPNTLFKLFSRAFPPVNQTFDIPVAKVDMDDYRESISYDFAPFISEMENTEFGRMVSHDYYYVAKVAETPQYTAIVYSSVNFNEQEMHPVYTTLVTYNPKGEVISKKLIGCQCSAEKVKRSSVSENKILIQDYLRIWEKPIDQVSFGENKVKEYKLVTQAEFQIENSGNIIDKVVPKEFKDSTMAILQK